MTNKQHLYIVCWNRIFTYQTDQVRNMCCASSPSNSKFMNHHQNRYHKACDTIQQLINLIKQPRSSPGITIGSIRSSGRVAWLFGYAGYQLCSSTRDRPHSWKVNQLTAMAPGVSQGPHCSYQPSSCPIN